MNYNIVVKIIVFINPTVVGLIPRNTKSHTYPTIVGLALKSNRIKIIHLLLALFFPHVSGVFPKKQQNKNNTSVVGIIFSPRQWGLLLFFSYGITKPWKSTNALRAIWVRFLLLISAKNKLTCPNLLCSLKRKHRW